MSTGSGNTSQFAGVLQLDYSNFISGLKKAAKGMGDFAIEVKDALKEVNDVVNRVVLAYAGMGTAVTAAVATMGTSFLSMQEDSLIAFTSLLKDSKKARKVFDDLAGLGAELPGFSSAAMVEAGKGMLNARFAAEELVPVLTAVADQVAAMGGGQEAFDSIVKGLKQIQQKGKVSSEEMTTQLSEVMPAWQYLADYLKTDVATAQKMVTAGQVDAATGIAALKAGMDKLGGTAKQMGGSFKGLWAGITDQAAIASAKMFEPMYEAFKVVMQKINAIMAGKGFKDALERIRTEFGRIGAAMATWAEKHGASFAKFTVAAYERFVKVLAAIAEKALEAYPDMEKFAKALNKAIEPILKLVEKRPEILGVMAAFSGLGALGATGALSSIGGVLGSIATAIGGLSAPVIAAGVAVAAFVGAVTAAAYKVGTFSRLWDGLKGSFSQVYDIVKDLATGAIRELGSAWQQVAPHVRQFSVTMEKLIVQTSKDLVPVIGSIAGALGGIFESGLSIATDALKAFLSVMELVTGGKLKLFSGGVWAGGSAFAVLAHHIENTVDWIAQLVKSLTWAVRVAVELTKHGNLQLAKETVNTDDKVSDQKAKLGKAEAEKEVNDFMSGLQDMVTKLVSGEGAGAGAADANGGAAGAAGGGGAAIGGKKSQKEIDEDAAEKRAKMLADQQQEAAGRLAGNGPDFGKLRDFMNTGATPTDIDTFAAGFEGASPAMAKALADGVAKALATGQYTTAVADSLAQQFFHQVEATKSTHELQAELARLAQTEQLTQAQSNALSSEAQKLGNMYFQGKISQQQYELALESLKEKISTAEQTLRSVNSGFESLHNKLAQQHLDNNLTDQQVAWATTQAANLRQEFMTGAITQQAYEDGLRALTATVDLAASITSKANAEAAQFTGTLSVMEAEGRLTGTQVNALHQQMQKLQAAVLGGKISIYEFNAAMSRLDKQAKDAADATERRTKLGDWAKLTAGMKDGPIKKALEEKLLSMKEAQFGQNIDRMANHLLGINGLLPNVAVGIAGFSTGLQNVQGQLNGFTSGMGQQVDNVAGRLAEFMNSRQGAIASAFNQAQMFFQNAKLIYEKDNARGLAMWAKGEAMMRQYEALRVEQAAPLEASGMFLEDPGLQTPNEQGPQSVKIEMVLPNINQFSDQAIRNIAEGLENHAERRGVRLWR